MMRGKVQSWEIGRTLSWSSCADVGCFGVNRATCGNHVLVHYIIRYNVS